MWIFLPYGFFSVTESHQKNGTLQVRARVRKHLENLKEAWCLTLKMKIVETKDADYRFRIIVGRKDWGTILDTETQRIDYPNFKDEAHRLNDPDWDEALLRVWGIMYRLQEKKLELSKKGKTF